MRLTLKNKEWACQLTTPMYEKLHNLEDIEEELGIDLIILFKALNGGIYFKRSDGRIGCTYPYEIALGDGGLSWKEWESSVEWYFKDYGKTWALTEKELL